jgi:radical SAM protein with 4Fe4S-binding SPASM domain
VSEDIDRLKCETADGGFWERVQQGHEFPLGVLYCATERCALKCPHCYQVRGGDSLQGKGEKEGSSPFSSREKGPGDEGEKERASPGAELTLPEIEKLLDELVTLGVFKFTITGGEPCLRRDLLEIVAAAWERRFLIALKTSGALLTGSDVEALRARGLSALHVSLYHIVPEKHDAFVGRQGAWRATMDAVETFHGLGGVVVVGAIAMDWNIDAIVPLRALCEEHSWSLTVDPKVNHRNDGAAGPTALRAAGDDLVAVIEKMPNIQGRGPERTPDDLVCLAGVNTVYIKPDGEVWPCPVMPLSMGNIRQQTLAEIWTDSPVRKRVLAMRWGDSAKCAACETSRFCQRCPGEAFQEHGDLAREATIDCAMAEAYARIWREAHPDD